MKKLLPLFLCLLGLFSLSFAQEPPAIKVSLIFAPEKQACNPDGYSDYANSEKTGCGALTIDQVEAWKNSYGYTATDAQSSKSSISLGDRLFGLLDAYRTAPKNNPDNRKSVVMIFDWKSPQDMDVRLTRKIMPLAGQPLFPEMIWEGRLEKERRWIHHERADALLPIHKVLWILDSGGQIWEFGTSP